MSEPTSTVKMLIPVTSLTRDQELRLVSTLASIAYETEHKGLGLVIETYNTEMKPVNLLGNYMEQIKKFKPDLVPSFETDNIEVCNPETVCAENCQEFSGCKKQ